MAGKNGRIQTRVLEIELTGRNKNFVDFLDAIPNPDGLLNDTGETLSIYREMKCDARIISLLELQKSKVLENRWYLDGQGCSEVVVQKVTGILKLINLQKEMKELLSALDYGYAVSEVVWQPSNGLWLPRLLNRKPERFTFGRDDTLYYRGDMEMQQLTSPMKFVVHRHESEGENPYGTSVLQACYWPWMFKKAGWRFWLITAEMFGVPTIIALLEGDDRETAERAGHEARASRGVLVCDHRTDVSRGRIAERYPCSIGSTRTNTRQPVPRRCPRLGLDPEPNPDPLDRVVELRRRRYRPPVRL